MTRIEVAAVTVCARCKGAKVVTTVTQIYDCIGESTGPCPACGGTGETRTVVICKTCRWYEGNGVRDWVEADHGWCTNESIDRLGIQVQQDWACASWTAAKGAQDGNG